METKRTNKKMLLSLAALLLLSVMIIPSKIYATETNTKQDSVEMAIEQGSGDMTIEEGAEPFVPSDEDLKIEAEKMSELNAFLAKPTTRASTSTWKNINIPVYKQTTGSYCAPATVKEVVQYHKGSSSAQDTYAKLLGTTSNGTDMTRVAPVLKSKTGKKYVMAEIKSKSLWIDRVRINMGQTKMAVVLDIKASTSNWKYSTKGHFLAISGAKTNGTNAGTTHVRLSDPHPKMNGSRYTETVNRAYAVNKAHSRHSLIW